MVRALGQVMDQVARAYLAGLRAQTSVETAKANVELSEALVKLAESQKNAGTGTGIERPLEDWTVVVRFGDRFEQVYRHAASNKTLPIEFQDLS